MSCYTELSVWVRVVPEVPVATPFYSCIFIIYYNYYIKQYNYVKSVNNN